MDHREVSAAEKRRRPCLLAADQLAQGARPLTGAAAPFARGASARPSQHTRAPYGADGPERGPSLWRDTAWQRPRARGLVPGQTPGPLRSCGPEPVLGPGGEAGREAAGGAGEVELLTEVKIALEQEVLPAPRRPPPGQCPGGVRTCAGHPKPPGSCSGPGSRLDLITLSLQADSCVRADTRDAGCSHGSWRAGARLRKQFPGQLGRVMKPCSRNRPDASGAHRPRSRPGAALPAGPLHGLAIPERSVPTSGSQGETRREKVLRSQQGCEAGSRPTFPVQNTPPQGRWGPRESTAHGPGRPAAEPRGLPVGSASQGNTPRPRGALDAKAAETCSRSGSKMGTRAVSVPSCDAAASQGARLLSSLAFGAFSLPVTVVAAPWPPGHSLSFLCFQ